MRADVKPCPFCGQPPGIYGDQPTKGPTWTIECERAACPVYVRTAQFRTESEVIEAWNTRARLAIDAPAARDQAVVNGTESS